MTMSSPPDARRFAALILVDPDQARAMLEAAYREKGCHAGHVADWWGVRPGTISGWIERLGMKARLAEIAEEERKAGNHHGQNKLGGRPIGSRDAQPRAKAKAVTKKRLPRVTRT